MNGKHAFAVTVLASLALILSCAPAPAQDQPSEQTPTGEQGPQEVTPPEQSKAPPGHVYFYLDGEPAPVERDITGGGQMIEFAVLELLKGPTDEEKAAGYVTYIPEGTKLQYTTIKQDRSEFSLNLSRELLEVSGDRDKATRALTQIVKTVQDVSRIQNVAITVAADAMGEQPQDAFEVLGVSRAEITGIGGGEEAGGGASNAGLVVGIVLGCLGALALVAIALAVLKRRAGSDRKAGTGKAGPSRRQAKSGKGK
jgi:hypothetical protein